MAKKKTTTHSYLPWSKEENPILLTYEDESSTACAVNVSLRDPPMRLRRSGLAQISDIGPSANQASVIRRPEKPLYEQILFLVRNMEVLTDPQMTYVRTLPKDKVLEIVDIYNRIMRNVNDAFS